MLCSGSSQQWYSSRNLEQHANKRMIRYVMLCTVFRVVMHPDNPRQCCMIKPRPRVHSNAARQKQGTTTLNVYQARLDGLRWRELSLVACRCDDSQATRMVQRQVIAAQQASIKSDQDCDGTVCLGVDIAPVNDGDGQL
jgi:hypothetical protein